MPRKTDPGYEKHREAMAELSREKSAKGRDIGELPLVVDAARKELCRHNLRLFLETYLAELFPLKWATFHITAIERLERLVLHGGLFANSLPRASGKSALFIGAILWCGVYGHRPYAAVVCAVDGLAKDFIQDVKTQIESGDLLADDFPEVCYPVRCLEGITLRAKAQTHNGERTKIGWTDDVIVFPTIAGAPSSVFRLATVGITGAIRGLKFTIGRKMVRPSFVLIDDPQTDESAKSITQTDDRIGVTNGAILGLSGPRVTMAAAMAVTVIRKGDYSDHYLNSVDWQGQRQGILNKMPDAETMIEWDKYRQVQEESLAQGKGTAEQNAYYAAHQQAIEKDLVATWPERFDPNNELTATQSAINLYYKVGRKKFMSEYMNEPEEASAADLFSIDPSDIRQRLTRLPRYQVPLGFDQLTISIDVQMRLLWYVVTAWRDDFTGSVIDYGWVPDQQRRQFTLDDLRITLQKASGSLDTDVDSAVSWGLEQIGKTVLDRRYLREDGMSLKITKGLIDINWQPSSTAVARFCRLSPWAGVLIPARGWSLSATRRKRISQWAPKDGERFPRPAERAECEWMISSAKQHKLQECLFDANHWKGRVTKAISAPLHSPGSISLYGEDPDHHQMLSEHLTSHYACHVSYGEVKDIAYLLRPGVERDDLLDCLCGSAVAASIEGVKLNTERAVAAVGKRRVFQLPGAR